MSREECAHHTGPVLWDLKPSDGVQLDYRIMREFYKQTPRAISLFEDIHFKASPQEAATCSKRFCGSEHVARFRGNHCQSVADLLCSPRRLQLCLVGKRDGFIAATFQKTSFHTALNHGKMVKGNHGWAQRGL